MYYKDIDESFDDSNCLDAFAVANQFNKILYSSKLLDNQPNNEMNTKDMLLMNTLFNFANSQEANDNLLTICDCLNESLVNLDQVLPNCGAIKRMIDDLHSDNTAYVLNILTTLCKLSEKSQFTLYCLCQEIALFSGLLDNGCINDLLPALSNLLFKVVKFDNGQGTFILAKDFNFVGKIINILDSSNYNYPEFKIISLNCITCIFEKLSREQLQIFVEGAKLIEIPLPNIYQYISSDEKNYLISTLKCYRTILVKWRGSIEDCLQDEIFIKIIDKLKNSHKIDESGMVFEETINIINVFIHFYVNTNNDQDHNELRLKEIISALITQINNNKQFASYAIKTLGNIANYKSTAKILIKNDFLQDLYSKYGFLSERLKTDLIKIFLYSTNILAHQVIEKCENIDKIFIDAFDILQDEDVQFAKSFFPALFHFLSEDNDKKNIFDGPEMIDLINHYMQYNECYDYCDRILRSFYSEDEEVSPKDLFI